MLLALVLLAQVNTAQRVEFRIYRCVKAEVADFEPLRVDKTGMSVVTRQDRERLQFVVQRLLKSRKLKLIYNPKVTYLDGKEFQISQSGGSDDYSLRGLISRDSDSVQIRMGLSFGTNAPSPQLASPMAWRSAESPVMWSFEGKKLAYFAYAVDGRTFAHE